ncbi:ketopantoate reductase family protein [Pseudomonas vanderleydeniana]|uniref:2-dehydropantoate 2-reductase n=1 Tax=Pseudomonas vanderleydeniana TaxID=2745495 RepID=A0A9E6TQT6_9PSED|nr:ketopantoate reductase family protein [Pseudomonas vanderleydeniana]QXI26295.1 ketopantoate reductase family protein [Pseudomonas vanderleydeniana]
MRVLIVGAGATGGFFGALLTQAGRDVTFLVRERRAEQLRQQGLRVVTPSKEMHFDPKLVTSDQIVGTYDVILLAVKAYSLDFALADMANAVGPNTVILPLLNGIKHIEQIKDRFGADHLLGCVCKLATNLNDQGTIIQQGTFCDVYYGELDGKVSERLLRVHNLLSGAGFKAETSSTIRRLLWEKWVLLAAMGCINCLMRGSIGDVVAVKGGLQFANNVIDEVLKIVRTVGEEPSAEFVASARQTLTLADSAQTSSMFRDLLAGRQLESEQIIGDLLTRAANFKIESPLLTLAYANLKVNERQLKLQKDR